MSEAQVVEAPHPDVAKPQHFISGQFVDSRSGETFEVVNPATEELTTMAARGA